MKCWLLGNRLCDEGVGLVVLTGEFCKDIIRDGDSSLSGESLLNESGGEK